MEFRRLGDSDIEVSAISLGSWLTYSGGVAREQAEACTRAAFEAGITFFDTANVYGRGASEEAWGEILPGYPRDSYVLATKLFWPMADDHAGGLSADEVHTQIDASLRRLRTDHVDLYQCHRFDVQTPIEETMEALSDVVRAGKARAIGFSEWTAEQIEAALAVSGTVKLVSSQPQYSALWRAPEDGVFDVCRANGISHVVWSPLAQGVLTGKYLPGQAPPPDSRAASAEMGVAIDRLLSDPILEAVQRLRPIADGAGLSMAHLALGWVLHHPEVASAIVGASRPEQVFDNAAAADVRLTQDVVDAVDAALADVAVTTWQYAYGSRPGVLHR
ncbi:MAG TPA: aldo/keto reductase family protein [Solirubrobacteraceae bacterium]|nr:aldo/keto reductase family protein [Solirubrobacteraceae bacterium]